jgi:serine/threonine-protein kinase
MPKDADGLGSAPTMATPVPSSGVTVPRAKKAADLAEGQVVGEYHVVGKLGEGGMGAVYAAKHPVIGKKAAVKVISQELCTDPEAVERFVQEARAVNQIGHPNIVDAFNFGTLEDGRCYFVMEWLQGESLGDRLRRGRMTMNEVLDVLEQICRALEAAHEKGIIHRDLKPDNIFLVGVKDDKPIVKLLDFGLAKLTGEHEMQLQRTRSGVVMGTPLYISPEQARGKNVGTPTDIYALGVVAYEMVLGRAPFVADSAMDIISMHLHQQPPAPRMLWPEVPGAIEVMLMSMLDKDPAQRPNAAKVRQRVLELRKMMMGSTDSSKALPAPVELAATMAPPLSQPPTQKRSAWPIFGGIALAAVVIGVGVVVMRQPPQTQTQTGTPTGTPTETRTGTQTTPVQLAVPPPQPEPQHHALPPAPPPEPGSMFIQLDGPAKIFVDGAVVAESAKEATVSAKPGPHNVMVVAPGREPVTRSVEIESHLVAAVRIKLPPKGHTTHAPSKKPPPQPGQKPPDDDDAPVNPFQR